VSESSRNTRLQVVATYQGSVLDVQHLQGPGSRVIERSCWIVGGVFVLVGLVAGGPGSLLGFGIAGLVPWMWALGTRTGRSPSRYTIGEGHGASFATPPVDLLTPEGFELAQVGRGGAAVVRFTDAMEVAFMAEGRVVSVDAWQRRGWALREAGTWRAVLPDGARCRVRHGALTFHLARVTAATFRASGLRVDVPFWATTGGSFVVLGSLLVLAHLSVPEAAELGMDGRVANNRFVGYAHQPAKRTPPKARPRPELRSPQPAVAATPKPAPPAPKPAKVVAERVPAEGGPRKPQRPTRAVGIEAAPAKSWVKAGGALMQRGTSPVDAARSAGVLAMVDTRPLTEGPYANAFSPDTDDRAMWQAMKDKDPTKSSIAGLDLVGKGRGGGPGSADDLVSTKPEPRMEETEETPAVIVRAGIGSVRGPRARDAVRGVVVRHSRALRRCYAQGVQRRPGLRGRLTLTMEVDEKGVVVSASVSRFADPVVADCIASKAREWRFTAVKKGGRSKVSMPLTLKPG